MVLNSLFPVIAMVVFGRVLSMTGLVDRFFLKTSDRLVYYIFFPCMLFWKIGSSRSLDGIDLSLTGAGIAAVLFVFTVSTGYIRSGRVSDFGAGSFSQACFRFNTYIGMAIVINALGDEGVLQFGILVGFVIPVINLLSVSILIWYSGNQVSPGRRLLHLAGAVGSNPLILACLAGIVFVNAGGRFPVFIDNTLRLISMVTLPLALISIGSSVSMTSLWKHLGTSAAAAGFKLVLLPLVGWGFLTLFGVTGVAFDTGMIFFCLPTSSAIYVLSAQMNSDTDLASACIVVSTLASILPLFLVLSMIR